VTATTWIDKAGVPIRWIIFELALILAGPLCGSEYLCMMDSPDAVDETFVLVGLEDMCSLDLDKISSLPEDDMRRIHN
jgi:hypothetical protein